MVFQQDRPTVGFVWSKHGINRSVIEMSQKTSTNAIFDVSDLDINSSAKLLLQAHASGPAVNLKISVSMLLDPDLEDLMNETSIQRVWIDLEPTICHRNLDTALDKISRLCRRFSAVPILCQTEKILALIQDHKSIFHIALKGNEASGFVGKETLFTLYGTVRSYLSKLQERRGLIVWGGLALPEAAAAFLSAGASGVVFESVHWLTDLAEPDEDVRQKLSSLKPDHTELVGLSLGTPCRFFNKGNSKAVKEIKTLAGSVCGAEVTDDKRRLFCEKIEREMVSPLSSEFSRDQLIPLGVEAAFAQSFVKKFGQETESAITGFLGDIERLCSRSPERLDSFVGGKTASTIGTQYPFIQGAMSWITDVPEFALSVALAGGLPTLALGLMDRATIERKFQGVNEIMSGKPYAVNIITLSENPYRNEQLEWVCKVKPRFAVIAAGEPSHAHELISNGVDVIYIAPTDDLVRLAFQAGIRYVICEGSEAGGHIGQYSTVSLAQLVLDMKFHEPDLFDGRTFILAGGIFNRETAFIAAMLGAQAIQMGTSYLATREIVQSGALSEVYQRMIIEALPESTVVTGEGTGLRVRSLQTPKIEAICEVERNFASGEEDENSFRKNIEALSAGSLFIAARRMDRPDGQALSEEQCISEGQFMSGACAGAISEVRSVRDFHEELARGKLASDVPFQGPIVSDAVFSPVDGGSRKTESQFTGRIIKKTPHDLERIAITGMSVVNSLGCSPLDVWQASRDLKSGITLIPPSKWDHSDFYDQRPRASEKTYCKVGAFMNLEISRKELEIPPQDFRTMTGATKVTMWLARKAIEESGILNSDLPRERISVLISQNSGEAAETLQDTIIRNSVLSILRAVNRVVDLDEEHSAAVAESVKAGRIAVDDTTLLGRLNCSAGGFICNKYGFMGPSYSVSAACATALVALYSAIQMIRNGIIDAALVGGSEEYLSPMHFLEFSALGALAGLSGVDRLPEEYSRPFDADRDGMVLGEGGGMIVIERESVANKRGADILGYITSMGASNNNRGMVESSHATQEIAIESSFSGLPYGPEDVDVVECHATGTRQGDGEEIAALSRFFGNGKNMILTSFKSQIGHTLGASGINSLIRGLMAMQTGILPPTINYLRPDPEIDLERKGFRVLPQPEEWTLGQSGLRRLQVNAFGFGGSNYVVQLEECTNCRDKVLVSIEKTEPLPKSGPESIAKIPDGVFVFRTRVGDEDYRVAVVADSLDSAMETLAKTEPMDGGYIAPKREKSLVRQGVFLKSGTISPSPLAFVFPGQGSHYAGMGHELYRTFPIIRDWMDKAADVAEFDILKLLFHDKEEDLQKTRWQQPALFTMEFALVNYLMGLGIAPSALAGHSLGELTALCLAGVYSFEDGFRIVNKRAVCMDKACHINADPGVMLACDAPMDLLEDLLGDYDNVYFTNFNSPHQIVIGGATKEVKLLGEQIKKQGHRSTMLRVSMAFHSPIMRCIHDELEEFVSGIQFYPPKLPVISNTTTLPFPDETAEIKRIMMAHLESPVQWMQNVRSLWNNFGIRQFVEVGPREILSNLIKDITEQADCIQTCLPSAEAVVLKTAVAQLYVRGYISDESTPKFVSLPCSGKNGERSKAVLPVEQTVEKLSGDSITSLQDTVIREINSFVIESFGKFLKPTILDAVRREHDPKFTPDQLDKLLTTMFPASLSSNTIGKTIRPTDYPEYSGNASDESVSEVAEKLLADESSGDVTETVIHLIMEATGYERSEIEPDMDLREDLSIRSSRLPVIMDSLEGHFGIKIEIEDFMDVRTIRDIADRIVGIVQSNRTHDAPNSNRIHQSVTNFSIAPVTDRIVQDIKRMVFNDVPLLEGKLQPVELAPFEPVAVFSARGGSGFRGEIGNVLRRDYGCEIIPYEFLGTEDSNEQRSFDIGALNGAQSAVESLMELNDLAGIVIIVDESFENNVKDLSKLSDIMSGFFLILKTFSGFASKKFMMLVHQNGSDHGVGRILADGIHGMFLTMAHELGSTQFRTIRMDGQSNFGRCIRSALDRSIKTMELIIHNSECFASTGVVSPWPLDAPIGHTLSSSDVIVFSGGGYGITSHLAKALVPFGCKMIFLGRTILGADARSKEIVDNLDSLKASGIDASYMTCDVTDPIRTREVMNEIAAAHGHVDGIVHGAGFLRDSLIKQMSSEDFLSVLNVKYSGALNLYMEAEKHGLKFLVCLSSAAALQGNPGQANYSSANRMMSALMKFLAAQKESVIFKALFLPPIEGAGMADNSEIRSIMARMNASYVNVSELSAFFCRELLLAAGKDVWVLYVRSLPEIPSVPLLTNDADLSDDINTLGTANFSRENFPMIDSILDLDLVEGRLTASRIFSQKRDPWVLDHKPFRFLRHPLVSAIMAVEAFFECAKLLFPYLSVVGIRDTEFLDIIECPPEVERYSEILCKAVYPQRSGEVLCDLSLSTADISPSGRQTDKMITNYTGTVILRPENLSDRLFKGGASHSLSLKSRAMSLNEVTEEYSSRSDMGERYRVIHLIDGASPDFVRGRTIYRETDDFNLDRRQQYQYSPYLLEAALQLMNFYILMRDKTDTRKMLPVRIGEMFFNRKCLNGEHLKLEGFVRYEDSEKLVCDCFATDEQGLLVMEVNQIEFRSISK
jgi:malonyl CoA-acyl carrier protein transacylase